ncbi:MAG TPA: DUF1587 domain-containing protein, partial [Bryobacteraceae bacterium]|nr:DUF1587 domain-containing protein [Bryobacteraceae bacterium]
MQNALLRSVAKAVLPVCASVAFAQGPAKPSFDHSVQPVLAKNCLACHNDRVQSGSVNLTPFNNPATLLANRDEWEKVVQKVRSGEMPPKGMPRPTVEQVAAFTSFIEGEWEKADRNVKPDPGRVTARRLNRVEYTNTIRDLLSVDFRAEKDFP